MTKRVFDFTFAFLGLCVLAPLFLLLGLLVKWDSPGPVWFRQERMGRSFHPFTLYKFRTMIPGNLGNNVSLTIGQDPRITRVGHLLRQTKLDELPQLLNVLIGDMSFVGPRPEMGRYVEMFREDYQEILRVRPGFAGCTLPQDSERGITLLIHQKISMKPNQ